MDINRAPILTIVGDSFTVSNGGTLALDTSILVAADFDDAVEDLIFYVSGEQNGSVERSGASLGSSNAFTYQQLFNGEISFVHNGSSSRSASFEIQVSDSSLASIPQTLPISVIEANKAPSLSIAVEPFLIDQGALASGHCIDCR